MKTITFTDTPSTIFFEHYPQLPTYNIKRKTNITALCLYGLYRNTIYDSYREKADLATDIKALKNEYMEKEDSTLANNDLYKSPIYHYAIAASLDSMKEWQDKKNMQCYVAYDNKSGHKIKIGFVHFIEQIIEDRPVVYIAQAGVQARGHGIGRHLMECVLAQYPANTEFYILTRVFNTEAKNLYQKRLGFFPIETQVVAELGYDSRYCGFKYLTTSEEIFNIKSRQKKVKDYPSFSKEKLTLPSLMKRPLREA